MAGKVQRLQGLLALTSASANKTQAVDQALDLLEASTITVQVRAPVRTGNGFLVLQHAPILDAAAFDDLAALPINGMGETETRVFQAVNRYLRWRVELASGEAITFAVDVLGRC